MLLQKLVGVQYRKFVGPGRLLCLLLPLLQYAQQSFHTSVAKQTFFGLDPWCFERADSTFRIVLSSKADRALREARHAHTGSKLAEARHKGAADTANTAMQSRLKQNSVAPRGSFCQADKTMYTKESIRHETVYWSPGVCCLVKLKNGDSWAMPTPCSLFNRTLRMCSSRSALQPGGWVSAK